MARAPDCCHPSRSEVLNENLRAVRSHPAVVGHAVTKQVVSVQFRGYLRPVGVWIVTQFAAIGSSQWGKLRLSQR